MSARHLSRVFLVGLLFALRLPAAPVTTETPRNEIDKKLSAIEGEVQRLRKVGATEDAQSLAATLQSLRDQVAGKDVPAQNGAAEVHVVGVYEGAFPVGPRKFGVAAVDVQITDRPIILVVCGYSPVRWTLRVAKEAKIEKLILAGYGEQELDFDLPGVAVEKHIAKAGDPENYFYTYGEESEGHSRALKIIRTLTGADVATISGVYRYADTPIVIGPANEQWRLQRALAAIRPVYAEATAFERAQNRLAINDIRFQAIYWKSIDMMRPEAVLAEFTPAGPIEGTDQPLPNRVNRIVADPRGPIYYGTSGHSQLVKVDLKNQNAKDFDVKGDLPEMSWPDGVAWDSKRSHVVVTSHGGVDEKRVEALILQLDAEGSVAREEAAAQLRRMGPAVEPLVKKALAGNVSVDVRKRLETVLSDLKSITRDLAPENLADPDLRREARAIRILALIGTPDAADFLRELTRGPAGFTRIVLARGALQNF